MSPYPIKVLGAAKRVVKGWDGMEERGNEKTRQQGTMTLVSLLSALGASRGQVRFSIGQMTNNG
jgi:hypothetical protein